MRSLFEQRASRPKDVEPGTRPPVTVWMDESGNNNADQPLIVGALALDIGAGDVEKQVTELYERLCARTGLGGWKTYEEFRRSGFHASNDPLDISVLFFDLISRAMGARAFIIMTTRARFAWSEEQRLRSIYTVLLADIVLHYRKHSKITVLIEQNEQLADLASMLESAVPRQVVRKAGYVALPEVEYRMIPKCEALAMGMVDYVLSAVSRWDRDGRKRDPSSAIYRNFRSIERLISLLYSVEDGLVSSRRDRRL